MRQSQSQTISESQSQSHVALRRLASTNPSGPMDAVAMSGGRRTRTRQGVSAHCSPFPMTPRLTSKQFFQEEFNTTAGEVVEEDKLVDGDESEEEEEEEEEGERGASAAPPQSQGERMQGSEVSQRGQMPEVWVVAQSQSQGERGGYQENPFFI